MEGGNSVAVVDVGGSVLRGGNGRLVHALTQNVPTIFEKSVHAIRYGRDSVKVNYWGELFEGGVAFCTVPLRVFKSGSIRFILEFPQQKLDIVKRLSFGLLNKVSMLFMYVFWTSNVDIFGHIVDDSSFRDDGKPVDENLD
ncbi:hypothetical protein R3W88_019313 [Solanum pinnatisectum]|uniref:Amine oxidase domain-containing protein n=1 Tax=Solanum pinnatisectum TaxID=50273 RepID=A0AAV9KJK7_9SOLN|nr:hypothetical protein R3W88_019313 [Solanum pinnatisectum]